MPIISLSQPRTVDNAPANAREVASLILDVLNPPIFVGPYPAAGGSCTMCGRTPPSNKLYKIIVDIGADEFVLIGIDVCTTQHLLKAVSDLLNSERTSTHRHRAARVRRLEDALAAIDR